MLTSATSLDNNMMALMADVVNWDLSLCDDPTVLTDMEEFWSNLEGNPEKIELMDLPTESAEQPDPLNDLLDWSLDNMENKEIVLHDCMWAGRCDDKYHPGNSAGVACSQATSAPSTSASVAPVTPPVTVQSALPGRSLLRRPSPPPVRRPVTPTPPPRPDTPQSLDEDEPPQFRHTVDFAGLLENSDDDDEDESVDDEEDEDVDVSPDPRHSTVAADHSYTLSKPTIKHHAAMRFENLGVQTPSDSEEEIDVVSLGDKSAVFGAVPGACAVRGQVALPTNPSMRDRHKLQRTVATAMCGRRDGPVHPAPRKRLAPPPAPSRKRPRNGSRRPRNSPGGKRRTHADSDSDVESVEKRSLHNDMERQRRIGLKNLFDELKREVPSTRDKERAPKVVILREAAALCKRLQTEDRERELLRKQQTRLLARVKALRMSLAAGRH